MKELVVISGKGGTGKTSLAAALACLAGDVVLADGDVDAADLHLLLQPRIKETHAFCGGRKAAIDPDLCTGCGRCHEVCRFKAIEITPPTAHQKTPTYRVNQIACEGCNVCVALCPAQTIAFNDHVNGQWFVSDTRMGPMVHARLGIAEENSGKLVTVIRRRARDIAVKENKQWLIVDGSPGVGCPVIASLTGADLALVVTEPTLSGRHDLGRVVELTKQLRIPTLVCINKADINPEVAAQIQADAQDQGLALVGLLPYSDSFTKAQMLQVSLVEYTAGALTAKIKALWQKIVYAAG
jgi:MinD superfamily P-loop ATPase